MHLTEHDIGLIAAMLACRLGTDGVPVDPADAPSYGDTLHDRWKRELRRAEKLGTTPRLIRAAARALPDDPVLHEASRLVAARAQQRVGAPRSALMVLATTSLAMWMTALGGLSAVLWAGTANAADPSTLAASAVAEHEQVAPLCRAR